MARKQGKQRSGRGRSTVPTLIYLLFGPSVWGLHLLAIYGPQSLLCARGLDGAVAPLVGAATLICVLLLLAALLAPGRLGQLLRATGWPEAQRSFNEGVVRVLAVLSLFGVLAGGATVLFLPACPGLR